MANDQLLPLAAALADAAQPLTLSAAWMGAHGATPPAGLDAALAAAFRLPPEPPGVTVAFDPGSVGPVGASSFEVSGARLAFLGWDARRTDVTLRFTQQDGVVDVLVAVAPDGWSWTDAFPHMTGYPFDALPFSDPRFVFTTAPATWDGIAVSPGQSFAGDAPLPDAVRALLEVVGLAPPGAPPPLAGPVVLDRVRDEEPTILYPDLDLRATLSTARFRLFFLDVDTPQLGLLVTTVEDTDRDEGGRLVTEYEQTPSLWFGAKLRLEGTTLDVRARALGDGGVFGFTVDVDPASPTRLTPATAIGLVAGRSGASFLAGVPGPLLALLDTVGLEGVSLSGQLDPPELLSAAARLGSAAGRPLVLFADPVGGQTFAIDRFWVEWTVISPLDPDASLSLVTLGAELTLWPSVFKDGPFVVTIDQDLRIDGGYAGTVQMGDVLAALTAGAVALPDGVAASVSDIGVLVDPRARHYAVSGVVDVRLDLLTVAGKPLLAVEGLEIALAALAPASGRATVFRASMAGGLAVGPLSTNVALAYDGAASPPLWTLRAALAEPLRLSELVGQFFRDYDLPDLLPGGLAVRAFAIDATLPVSGPARYALDGTIGWDSLPFGADVSAQLQLAYDGARDPAARFSGAAIGRVRLAAPALEVEVGYRFGTDPDGRDSRVLWVSWAGVRGEYDSVTERVTLSLAGWSVGSLISALVRTLGDPWFELPSPWNLLDRIPLDGLRLVIDTSAGARRRLSASYVLSSPIELGFVTIRGLVVSRGEDGRVLLAIDGSCTIPGLRDDPLFRPESGGQDVRRLPDVPGQGTQWFQLHLLALGQRVAIRGSEGFASTREAIRALEAIPPTTGDGNPVDPSSPVRGQPYYDREAGWLVAAHLGILRVGRDWTFDLQVVFADPDLYGLRLAFAGEKAKILDGLALDVSYRKVSDDVGVYQLEFSFPRSLRTFDLGAFTITLPTIGLRIYTNGDFLFDFGFPYNLDFSRSFTLQAIVYGVPVLGSAGFYFGKLPPGDVPALPRDASGSFSSAIVFGLGIQLGVGRYFERGPLKAGFSITVFGIVEGAIAAWHPPAAGADLLPRAVGGGALQGDYWFRLEGTFGIVGKLYGSVDFAIVKADVNLRVTLAARVVYEAFANIELSASASVEVSVSIKIDLGLFSIRISFSFSTTITADLTIETSGTPPWRAAAAPAELRDPRRRALAAGHAEPLPPPAFKTVVRTGTRPSVRLTPAPQLTVLGPEAGPASAQEGAFVLLLAIDAPVADGEGNRGGSSFEALCAGLLPWLLDGWYGGAGTTVDLDAFARETSVTGAQLEAVVRALAGDAPLSEPELEEKLLAAGFAVDLAPPSAAVEDGLRAGASVFPAFAGLTVTVPDPAGGPGTRTVALGANATVDGAYRATLAARFRALAAQVEDEAADAAAAAPPPGEGAESVARFVFEDWFAIVAQQLVQAAADVLGDYAYAPAQGDSLGSIAEWAASRGNAVTPLDVAAPNAGRPLAAGRTLHVPGLAAAVQAGDTALALAARFSDPADAPRWTTSPRDLLLANAGVHGLVAGGVEVALAGAGSVVTLPGDSLADVAAALGVGIEALAADAGVQGRSGLLVPGTVVAIPDLAYVTADGGQDTLDGLVRRFGVPLAALAGDARNQEVGDLFAPGALAIAGLERLFVADLWEAIRRSDRVAQVAGMVARFSLHGMRLPTADGLALGAGFLAPTDAPEYGLCQLTGQQVPVPPLGDAPAYTMTVGKDATLDWLELGGSATARSLALALDEPARQLSWLLRWAREHGYDPAPAVAPEPAAAVGPKRYALPAATPWTSSDAAAIAAVARPPGAAGAAGAATAAAAQPQPLLWPLPASLLEQVARRQAALRRRFPTLAEQLPHLPRVAPEAGVRDPASGHTAFAAVDDVAFVARIPFEVKRLAQTDDRPPQRPDATDAVPPGPGNAGAPAPLAPWTYELVGPSAADAPLLERLLTAMDSLGEDLVSDVFLLVADGAGARPGLASRGADELLAFLLQTNLSTETNPPPALRAGLGRAGAARPARGIANRPAELVKLLWECSTVRSGGFYLHYELPDEGAGLPAAIFDGSGSATVTLVVALDRERLGDRLADVVNGLVTTAPLDVERTVMTVRSVSAPQAGAPLLGGETLGELAALYGTDVGRLAELNATAPLAPGSAIPLEGVLHQVTPADLAGGDALAAVAARFSRGAQTPLSAAALAAFNPGASPALGATLRIPPLRCVVPADGPGGTLAQLRDWYGLSFDALGAAARDVPGLLGSAVPRVDAEERDLLSGLGTGNAGIELERASLGEPAPLPPDPTPAQVEAFARPTLFSLYTLLQAQVAATPFFDASPPGMPFGPRRTLDPAEAHARREPARRRAALRAAARAAEPLRYAQTVGYGPFALVDPAPGSGGPNPYAGIGTPLALRLRWLDVFGNVVPTPFGAPPPGYEGPLNGLPVPLGYADRLIGLAQWPNVRAEHAFAGEPGAPELTVTLRLETAAYEREGGPQLAARDLAAFLRVRAQLAQDYDGAGVPGLAGRAVRMVLESTLLAEPRIPLGDERERQVRDFVDACVAFLQAAAGAEARGAGGPSAAQGGPAPAPLAPVAQLRAPVALDALADDDVLPVRVALALERQERLLDPALRALPDGGRDATPILPQGGEPGAAVSLRPYAEALERAFVTDAWQLRVGTAAAAADEVSVWAVRMARRAGAGLGYAIGDAPSFYAPRPLARALRTARVELSTYERGRPFPAGSAQRTFTGVDPNAWAQQAFRAVDAFLTPAYAGPTVVLDRLLGTPDPDRRGLLARILAHKATLADAVAATAEPILEASAEDAASRAAAGEKLRQALLDELSAAFAVTAVAVFPVADARARRPLARGVVAPPRFFGQPLGAVPGAQAGAGQQNFALSSAKVPLTRAEGDGETRLAFLFSSKDVADEAFVTLDLSYAMTQLEHDIRHVPGIEGYEQSAWIAFVTGPFTAPVATGVEIPIVLRALPQPPTVLAQTARASVPRPASAADLARWDFAFEYLYPAAAQDTVTATVRLGVPPALAAQAATAEERLFAALAQLVTAYPDVAADLDAALRPLDGRTRPDDPAVQVAADAVRAFEQLVGAVADAYAAWARPAVADAGGPAAAAAAVTRTFELGLSEAEDGRARVDVYVAAGADVPAPDVRVAPDAYEPRPAGRLAPGAAYGFEYVRIGADGSAAGDWLDYPAALALPARAVGYDGLDVFATQNGWASAHVVRNERLVPHGRTRETFRFATPEVQFADPVVPLLAHPSFDLASVGPGPAPLSSWLETFLAQLLAGAQGRPLALKLAAAYGLRLAPGAEAPETRLPIALLPVTAFVPSAGEPPAFVAPFADRVTRWLFDEVRPAMDDRTRLTLALELFAGAPGQATLPLLAIADLSLATSALSA